jgi:hypothetical protein
MIIITIMEHNVYESQYCIWSTNCMNVVNDYSTNCVIIITDYGAQCLRTPVLHMEYSLCEYFCLQKQSLPQAVNRSNSNSSVKTAQFALPKDTALDRVTICIKQCYFLETYTVTSVLSSAIYCC